TSARATAAVHVYDLATRTWSNAAPLPAARGGHAAVVLDGKIHVVGGGNDVSTLDLHSVYDPATNRWTAAAPLPRAKGSPAAVVLDGKLWAIGGRSGPDDYGDVDVYDPAADSWSAGPSIPPRGTHGASVLDDAIYVFGGESQARGAERAGALSLERCAAGRSARRRCPEARPGRGRVHAPVGFAADRPRLRPGGAVRGRCPRRGR